MEPGPSSPINAAAKREVGTILEENSDVTESCAERGPSKRQRIDDSGTEDASVPEPVATGQSPEQPPSTSHSTKVAHPQEDEYGLDLSEDESGNQVAPAAPEVTSANDGKEKIESVVNGSDSKEQITPDTSSQTECLDNIKEGDFEAAAILVSASKPKKSEYTETTDAVQQTSPTVSSNGPHENDNIDLLELEFKFLEALMRTLWKNGDAWPFHVPVDADMLKLPDYYKIITNPIDMTAITEKLKSRKYQSVEEFTSDWELMFSNCRLYNKPESDISRMADNLEKAFRKQMEKMPTGEELKRKFLSKAQKKGARKAAKSTRKGKRLALNGTKKMNTVLLSEDGKLENQTLLNPSDPNGHLVPGSAAGLAVKRNQSNDSYGRRQSRVSLGGIEPAADVNLHERALDNRPARDRKKPESIVANIVENRTRHKINNQLKYCGKILSDFLSKKSYSNAWPFVEPVDPVALNLPDYFTVIKKPMDLSKMQKKYDNREYANAQEFAADMRVMFANCYRYNPPGHDVFEIGKRLQSEFEGRFAQLPDEVSMPSKEKKSKGKQRRVAGTSTSEYYGSDDEAEEVVNVDPVEQARVEQLKKMQEMVATLQSGIEELTRTSSIAATPATTSVSSRRTSVTGSKRSAVNVAKSTVSRKASVSNKNPVLKSIPDIRPMTFEEKRKLSLNINRLSADRIPRLVSIIQARIPSLRDCPAEELEIDIDSLDPLTLRELEKYVQSVMSSSVEPQKKRTVKRAPPASRKRKVAGANTVRASKSASSLTGSAIDRSARSVSKSGSGYLSDAQRMRRGGSSSSSSSSDSGSSTSSSGSSSDSESDIDHKTSMGSLNGAKVGLSRLPSTTGNKSTVGTGKSNDTRNNLLRKSGSGSYTPSIDGGIVLAPGPPPPPKPSKLLLGAAARTGVQPTKNISHQLNAVKMPSSCASLGNKEIKVGNANAWSSLAKESGVSSGINTPRNTPPTGTSFSPNAGVSNSTSSVAMRAYSSPRDASGDRFVEYRKKAMLKSKDARGVKGALEAGPPARSDNSVPIASTNNNDAVSVSKSPSEKADDASNNDREKRREEERRRRAQETDKGQTAAAHDAISGEALEEMLFG
eukprot:CFRG5930T1